MADPIPLRDPFQFPQRSGPPTFAGIGAAPTFEPDQIVEVTEGVDGSIDILITDQPLADDTPKNTSFDENLAALDELSTALPGIAYELIEGIEADEDSRGALVQNYNEGLSLLGLQITKSQGVNSESMSTVTHPVMLEAILRFRALARGEILPASGPAKVRNDGDESTERQSLADDLETDVNHYLTVDAPEYYPDTDRGLIYLAFGGDIFKKVYRCPIRRRPVSECVYLPDLIVSQDATDLDSAERVTHRIEMTKTLVKRLMASGAYIETDLSEPTPNPSATDRKEKEIQGISPVPARQEDYNRTIYECYTELDLSPSLKEKDAPEDLPLPYRVTIDKDSRKVLEIRRNWRDGDRQFRKRQRFVKWPFMPGMGFYDLGYLHILGQHAKALTALWRIMIDAGMFANFPGGVKLKGARSSTNQIRPNPGQWVDVDGAGATDIRSVLMPMPYKEVSATLLQLTEMIEDDARKLAGTVDLEAGEGRTNVPVGTIMAMIEQQTQMMTAVHKGLHQAQAREFQLMRELFAEDPESLTRDNPKAKRQWTEDELRDLSLVPASDPNIPAHIHRTMQGTALAALAQNNPLYNQMAVQKRLLETLNISDADELLVQPPSGGAGDGASAGALPPALAAIAQGQLATEGAKVQATVMKDRQQAAIQLHKSQQDFQSKLMDFQTRLQEHEMTLADKAEDRKSKEAIAAMKNQTDLIIEGLQMLGAQTSPDPAHDDKAGP